jgi:hypothetical protein
MTEVFSKRAATVEVLKKVSCRTLFPKNRWQMSEAACLGDAANETSSREKKGSVVRLRQKFSPSKSERRFAHGPNQSPEPTSGLRPAVAHL